jgi:large subunit ribosomal protein L4
LKNLGTARGKTLLVLPEHDEKILRASRNIPTLQTAAFADLNTYQVLHCDRLVLLESALTRMREAEVKS